MSHTQPETVITWPADWTSLAALAGVTVMFLAGLPLLLTQPLEQPLVSFALVLCGIGTPFLWCEGVGTRVRFGRDAFTLHVPLCYRRTIPYTDVLKVGDDEIQTVDRTLRLPDRRGPETAGELRRRMNAAGTSPEANAKRVRAAEREQIRTAEARRLRDLAPRIALYREVPLDPRLARALRTFRLDALRDALASGATPNARDARGLTPLMRAARAEWVDGVRVLLEAGADPLPLTDEGDGAADMIYEVGMARYSADGNAVLDLLAHAFETR